MSRRGNGRKRLLGWTFSGARAKVRHPGVRIPPLRSLLWTPQKQATWGRMWHPHPRLVRARLQAKDLAPAEGAQRSQRVQ